MNISLQTAKLLEHVKAKPKTYAYGSMALMGLLVIAATLLWVSYQDEKQALKDMRTQLKSLKDEGRAWDKKQQVFKDKTAYFGSVREKDFAVVGGQNQEDLTQMAAGSGLSVKTAAVLPVKKEENMVVLSWQIDVLGSWSAVQKWIYTIEKDPRPFQIMLIQCKPRAQAVAVSLVVHRRMFIMDAGKKQK